MSITRKLGRSQLRPWVIRTLREQGGVCLLCKKPIDLAVKGEAVADHNHISGHLRGVLHRSCNAALGKMEHAVGRWGCKSMQYEDMIPWIAAALEYYGQPEHPFLYPTHKTADELRIQRNAKERVRRAERKARATVRSRRVTTKQD